MNREIDLLFLAYMKEYSFNPKKLFLSLILISELLFSPLLCLSATQDNHPFWTEKSSFIEGNTLYAVGVASNVKTVETGRESAFVKAKAEIMNYAQIANLEGAGIIIETQMTYEEKNKDGTYNIYRLIKTDLDKLLSSQKDLQITSQKKMEEMNKIIEINKAITDSFINKRGEIEDLTKKGGQILSELEKIKKSVSEKGAEFDALYSRLQKEVESRNIVISKIEEKKKILDRQDESLEQLRKQIIERILNKEKKVKKYITKGMTKEDVKSLIGEPDNWYGNNRWHYGRASVDFDGGNVDAIFLPLQDFLY